MALEITVGGNNRRGAKRSGDSAHRAACHFVLSATAAISVCTQHFTRSRSSGSAVAVAVTVSVSVTVSVIVSVSFDISHLLTNVNDA